MTDASKRAKERDENGGIGCLLFLGIIMVTLGSVMTWGWGIALLIGGASFIAAFLACIGLVFWSARS
jgi:hypothetical protein